jgi:protein involved in polysaccharide export with SLBB domain
MKAIRFIALFSFLLIINLVTISVVNSQETKTEVKTIDASIKPVVSATVVPVQTNKLTEERYRIGQFDVLEVNVYKHPELSQGSVKIDDLGRIRLPRMDAPITAICKTENELAAEIIDYYKKTYLRDPYVTVVVREQNSQPLSVIGAVKKPGSFFTNRRLTLLELLSFAGGPDVEFAGTKLQVARVGGISGCTSNETNITDDEGVTYFGYELASVLEGKTNPIMKPGDIVVVLEADKIYVTGNVVKPQAISLKQSITLTQAVAAAGGVLPATKKNQVRIIRQESGGQAKTVELMYDLTAIRDKKIADPVLIANDIVEVPTDKVKDFTNNLIKAVTGGVGNIFTRIPIQ